MNFLFGQVVTGRDSLDFVEEYKVPIVVGVVGPWHQTLVYIRILVLGIVEFVDLVEIDQVGLGIVEIDLVGLEIDLVDLGIGLAVLGIDFVGLGTDLVVLGIDLDIGFD